MNLRLVLALAISVLIISTQGFTQNQKEGVTEDNKVIKGIFGLSIDSHIFKEKGYGGVARYLKGLGINTVVGLPLDRGLINELRAQGLSCYAEISIFAGEEYWTKHPNTRPLNSKGEPIAKEGWYAGLCPTQEGIRKEKLSEIKRIVENFALDGIWLDFIRYPCHWEVISPALEETCFCDVCIGKFKADSKIDLPINLKTAKEKAGFIMSYHRQEWHDWRCEQIIDFAREAKKILVDKNPKLELGLFAVPWEEEDFNNAITNIIAQDFKKLSSYIDIFSPMVYNKMCGRDASWIGRVIRHMRDKTNKKVVPILQAQGVSDIELTEAIREALSNSKNGVVIFNMDSILNDKKEKTVRDIFGAFENTNYKSSLH